MMTNNTLTSTTAASVVDEAALIESVQNVWTTLLATEATPTQPEQIDGTTASISIAGAWNATVTMTMSDEAVAACAAGLFGLEVDDLDDELKSDAIGEIVNVVGGNLKSLVFSDPPSTLSLPIVTRGVPDIVGAKVVEEVGFDTGGHHVVWRIHSSRR